MSAGERPGLAATSGLTAALIGVLVLLLPGATAPPVLPALLMLGAGVAWGLYSLGGRGSTDPVADTAGQFLKAVPITAPRSCRESPRV
jgi:drug/metabolite transporter (DMT)-like permease